MVISGQDTFRENEHILHRPVAQGQDLQQNQRLLQEMGSSVVYHRDLRPHDFIQRSESQTNTI